MIANSVIEEYFTSRVRLHQATERIESGAVKAQMLSSNEQAHQDTINAVNRAITEGSQASRRAMLVAVEIYNDGNDGKEEGNGGET